LPLTDFEVHVKADNEFEIEGKLRKSINILLVCALKGLRGKQGPLFKKIKRQSSRGSSEWSSKDELKEKEKISIIDDFDAYKNFIKNQKSEVPIRRTSGAVSLMQSEVVQEPNSTQKDAFLNR
jgi:hypothetical protein